MEKEKLSIGIDIGGTNIELAWVKKDGSIIKNIRYKTKVFSTAESMVERASSDILNNNKYFNNYDIIGIGIGAPNGNYFSGSIEFAPNLNWGDKIKLAEMFETKTGLKTKLTNDANAAAFAEKIFGGAKNMKNFLVVTLGTGLGSGIFVNGQMLYGHTGFAGELGHTTAIDNGRECKCGKKGCLETYASATGIVITAKDFLQNKKTDSSLQYVENINSYEIYSAAKNSDELALKTIYYTGEILAKSLVDYIALFSPEAIFLTGGLAKSHSILIPATEKHINKHILKIYENSVKLLPSTLIEKNAGLLGAAAMIFENK